jgi:hypothetical protein
VRGAEERTWEVVRRAYADRPARPPHRRASNSLLLALVCAALLVAAAVMSPPGRAVFERMRQAVGVAHAAPAIFSLPSHGDLLVVSGEHGGAWLVRDNGLKRRIGSYDDAQWSPHGKFIVATKGDELVALDPDGDVHWTLARPGVRWPRWEGTAVDTRIAYVDRDGLRVVAGDGTGDHGLDRLGGGVPPAWDPARLHTLAYHAPGSIVTRRVDGKLVWRFKLPDTPTSLAWSSDGRELAVVTPDKIVVLSGTGRALRTVSMLGSDLQQAAFAPGTHRLAIVVHRPGRSEVRLVDVDHPGNAKLLFAGPGKFHDIAWSPDARWLLVAWPTANQWVFLRGSHVQAVGSIEEQFPRHDRVRPRLRLSGWCCS